MPGRKPKPVLLKMAQGDTRKLGARRFAEECAKALIARRGAPPMPSDFEVDPLPQDATAQSFAEWQTASKRCELARAHWQYLIEQLGADGLLCQADQGVLAGLAWCYARRSEAALYGSSKEFAELDAAYRANATLCGLNESARAKMQRQAPENQISEAEAALGADLPPDEMQPVN